MILSQLNVQTNSNLSFSFIKVKDLISWAQEKKLEYLSICDYYPFDFFDFFDLCHQAKIKPIVGIKVFIKINDYKKILSVYPKNNKGYKEVIQNLFNLDSPNDRLFELEKLEFLLKNCLLVLQANNLEELNFFQEFLAKKTNLQLFIGFNFFLNSSKDLKSKEFISRLIPFLSIKFISKKEAILFNYWRNSSYKNSFFSEDVNNDYFHYLDQEDYFYSSEQFDKTFCQLMLINLRNFASKINLKAISLITQKKQTKDDQFFNELESRCLLRLIEVNKHHEEFYRKRLEEELRVIKKLFFSEYLLSFADIVEDLKKKKFVVGPGRGSSVSSLVVYLLRINQIDPLQHNLFFERFINEERVSVPDIDLDVENQEEVFNYLSNKHGSEKISRIFLKEKIGLVGCLKEYGNVLKIEEEKIKKITFLLKKEKEDSLQIQSFKISYPLLFALVKKISVLYHRTSVHPSGIVVSDKNLVGLIPLKREKDFCLSLYEERSLNKINIKKYDFLSLKNTFNFINFKFIESIAQLSEDLNIKLPEYNQLDLEDKKTWHFLKNFLLTGIFHLDSLSARDVFFKFRPKNFSELIVFLGLNRPIARNLCYEITKIKFSSDLKKTKFYEDENINGLLKESYGFVIFQEQVTQILALVYQISFAKAEKIRKENFKDIDYSKIKEKLQLFKLTNLQKNFLANSLTSSFNYAFNKSHAVAYAYLVYFVAYIKANFFPQIIIHLLEEKREKAIDYIEEAAYCGFFIAKPDINFSLLKSHLGADNTIRLGFSFLPIFKKEIFEKIIVERDKNGLFKSFQDFIDREYKELIKIKKEELKSWVSCGLFSSLEIDHFSLSSEIIEQVYNYINIKANFEVNEQILPFIKLELKSKENNLSLTNYAKFIAKQNHLEKENFGFYIDFLNRWRRSDKKLKINSFLDIFKKDVQSSEKDIVFFSYSLIISINKEGNFYRLILKDIQKSFVLILKEDLYEKNKEILIVENELIFHLFAKVKNGLLNSLICKSIDFLQ